MGYCGFLDNGEFVVEEVLQCTSKICRRLFIAAYKFQLPSVVGAPGHYAFVSAYPREPNPPEIPEVVENLSPRFSAILRQAYAADALNLTEVTGLGFRKALEILVKDFAISRSPSASEEIARMPLMKCINEHIADPKLREAAKRATWLGNDEAHYLRVWRQHDLGDLKLLIRITSNFLENELLYEQYLAEMPGTT